MRSWNELTSVDYSNQVLESRRQDEVRKEMEQFRLEREALKARQGDRPFAVRGLGWLRQQLSTIVNAIVKRQPQRPNPPVFTRR